MACALTGEAAGTAAAQAIDQDTTAQALDVAKLQEALAKANVVIHIPEEMKGNAGQPTTVEADPRYQHKTHIRFSSAELNAGFKKMY